MNNTLIWLLLLGVSWGLSGCNTPRASERPPAPMSFVKPTSVDALNPKKGSIWQSTDRNTLFIDNKARNIGDVVTVRVSENSQGQKDAKTSLSRDGTSEMNLGGLFGLTGVIQGKNQGFQSTANVAGKHEHEGEGQTSRNGALSATISCVVTEILPNGNLRIEGRRDITINHENQYLILSGVVRPEDITQNNTVLSAQVADARIDYSGEGDVDDQQRPSWINQLFSAFRIL